MKALRKFLKVTFVASTLLIALTTGCEKPELGGPGASAPLSQVPAVRLNYRYEADVPPPTEAAKPQVDERNALVQKDFDETRPTEQLDKTIPSPDGRHVAAIYHRIGDLPSEYRLDMYSAEGKQLRKMTADQMAVHFPDTIQWSPDSANLAFVAMLRGVSNEPEAPELPEKPESLSNSGTLQPATDPEAEAAANSNSNGNTVASTGSASNANGEEQQPDAVPTPTAPTGILTFRTEQIYIGDANGENVRPITQNDGLIYFFYTWAPDSSALAALASTQREWQYLNFRSETNGEVFVPMGRPRVVEKNGRERRLDDALTAVRPVWSPDSTKVAAGYGTQLRIYDAIGVNPTQAALPLRNQLLISSQAYDREQAAKLNAPETAPNAEQQVNQSTTGEPTSTLPDEKTLVSFNPIVGLAWTSDDLLYFQTAYIRLMKKQIDSVTSFPRWHRIVLSAQPQPK